MPRTRRSFSSEEKLSIIQEAEREGYMETCRKYNLSPALLSRWKQKYQAKGTEGLKPAYKRIDPEVRALEQENERLKRIIARQALEIEVKSELLKKTPIQPRKK
ncbi:MAG: transposase [Citrobacter freundii]|nr:MAG: transposase [Citrobacter freundii]